MLSRTDPLTAPLLFARDAIVIAIHPHVGAVFKKNVASAQEIICEQWIRPSHREW